MPVAGAFFLGGMGWGATGTLAATYAGAYAAGASVLGTIATRLLTTVAMTALSSALASQPTTAQSAGIRASDTGRGDVNPDSFILGRYATAGSHVCPPYTHGKRDNNTPNPYLQYVIHLGGAPGQRLAGMTVDGRACSIEGPDYAWDPMNPMNTRYRHYSSNEEKQRFYGRRVEIDGLDSTRCWVRYHDGTQTEVDGPLHYAYRGRSRAWSEDMIGAGICYAVVTFQMKKGNFAGFPVPNFILEGIGLYDPRKDSTAGGDGPHRWDDPATHEGSENPAVQIYNLLRGVRLPGGAVYGGRARADQLPVANWMAAMDACDLEVEVADGVTEPAWRTSYEVLLSDEPAGVIEELCKAASIQLAEDGGTWRIRVGGPGVPVAHITDLDIISTADQTLDMFPGLDATHNGVSISFPDPGSGWKPAEAPLYTRSDYEAQDGGKQLIADLSMQAAPYANQNQRLARAYVEEERRFRRHVLTLPPDYGALEVLDAIAWTSDREGYDAKVFEIAAAGSDPVTQLVTVTLRERDPEDYDWTPEFQLPYSPQPIVWGEAPLAEPAGFGVRGLALVDAEGVARRAALELSWSTVDLDGLTAIQWEYRLKGSDQILRGNTTDVIAGIARIVEGVLPGQTYEVQAQVVARGFEPVWTGWMEATTPPVQTVIKTDLAPDLQNLIDTAHDGGGLSRNPTFQDWAGAAPTGVRLFTSEGTIAKVTGEAARYGNALEITTANPPTVNFPAVRILSSDNAGPLNPAMVTVRMEIELRAGRYGGALLQATWTGANGTVTQSVPIHDDIGRTPQANIVKPVEVTFTRPEGYTPGANPDFHVTFLASAATERTFLRCRIHRFDVEERGAKALATIVQKTRDTVDGITSSSIGLRAKAGEEEALLELVALSNPQGSASAFRIRADQIKLEGEVDAETMIVGQMSSEHLVVNSRLTLEEDAALNYGKGSLTDSRDGIFFGKEGDTGFGLSVSRTANDRRQSIDLTKNRFRLLNARHAVTASSFPVALTWSASTAKKALPAGVREIQVQGVGGGGGGRNDAGANDGTATVVRLYDGTTLKYTLTCPGGLGGKNDRRPAHHTSAGRAEASYYTNGDRGVERYADCDVPGAGGGGGRQGRTETNDDVYEGGRAAPLTSSGTIDVTGWASPMIEVILGVGGAGIVDQVGKSGHGGPGFAEASYTTYVELPADVVPLQPTARGTFSKPSSGSNLSFPNLGAGFWVLDTNGGNDLGLNTVTIAPDTTIWLGHPINAAFFSSQTPTYSPADSTRTIHYKFYSMGSWG